MNWVDPIENMKSIEPEPNLIKSCIFSLIAFFFLALMGLFIKGAVLHGATPFQTTFVAYVFAASLTLPFIACKGMAFFKTERIGIHFLRTACGVSATLFYVYAIQKIPVVNATLLFNTAPIFIPILGIFILNQPVTKREWIAIFIGFIGVILVVQPTSDIFHDLAGLVGLLAGACLAMAFICIKKLNATEPLLRIVAYFFLFSNMILLPFLFFSKMEFTQETFLLSLAVGCSLLTTQLCLIKAYQYGKPAKVGVFQYTAVVFVGFSEWLIWGKHPSTMVLAGILIVAMAGSVIILNRDQKV